MHRIVAIALLVPSVLDAAGSPAKPQLPWGTLFSPTPNALVQSRIKRVLQVADTSLTTEFHTVPALHLEGALNADPLRQQSTQAVAQFPAIFDLAVCARLSPPDQ